MGLIAFALVTIDVFVIGRRNSNNLVGLALWGPALLLLILSDGPRFLIALWAAVVTLLTLNVWEERGWRC